MSRTLFELNDEMQQLLEAIEFLDEDDAGVAAVIDGYLSRLQGDLDIKIDNYAALIRELDTRAEARREEGNRILHRAKVDTNRKARLVESLRWYFVANNLKTLETPRYRLTLAPNGGKQPVMLTVPVEELPPDYLVETISIRPNLDAIRQALEAGQVVPGATLAERGASIRIM